MLQESTEGNDTLDEYIYNILKEDSSDTQSSSKNTKNNDGLKLTGKLDQIQNIFLQGSTDSGINNEEEDELIQRLQKESALDEKYEQFAKKRDEELEERYLKFKKDAKSEFYSSDNDSKPKGTVPKPFSGADLIQDEMDNWCCKVFIYMDVFFFIKFKVFPI
ncbi:MAG: hypothetical protein EXX96DRAFT_246749 [Benjaminiella poitrasii]|nr:MAG: hypothetical protein EXX96DRAFT_246749 [Benjaminiella poitrasii]